MDIVQLVLMLIVGIILDIASIVPVLNFFTDFVAIIVFGIWFYVLGMGIVNARKLAGPIVAMIIEAVPAASIIPSITLSIIITYILIRIENKTGVNVSSVTSIGKGGGNINNL